MCLSAENISGKIKHEQVTIFSKAEDGVEGEFFCCVLVHSELYIVCM